MGIAMVDTETMEIERQADLFVTRRDCTDLRKAFIEGWRAALEYHEDDSELLAQIGLKPDVQTKE